MSNRTWACVACGKTYRRDQSAVTPVRCAHCGQPCDYVHWKIRVPSPSKRKEWDKFWSIYRTESILLKQYLNDPGTKVINLALLNMRLGVLVEAPRKSRAKKPKR